MKSGLLRFSVLATMILGGPIAIAHETSHAGHDHSPVLGRVQFPVSCSKEAQREFNRAVALLHHMTYPQAREAFESIAVTDPACAMAHWGVAMTLFQPLWPTRPGPDALRRGFEEVAKAKTLSPGTERERLFIAAAEAFYVDPASSDYWQRIRRWEQGMHKLYSAFPEDPEAMAFYALAHLASATDPATLRKHADESAALLMRVYEANPEHPGAMHYLVHANDVPGREHESLEITRKYDEIAPQNPHALHMPTHIYTRLGNWDGSIQGNLAAAQAALKTRAGDRGQFVWDEFPHAVEYLVYAYLQKGEDDAALAQVERLRNTPSIEPTFKTAFHLASTQARYALERRDWSRSAALVPRMPASLDWDRFTWPEAITRFARGLGAAHLQDVNASKQEIRKLEELEAATRNAAEDLFARNIQLLRLELSAWVAHVEGDAQSGIALLREAAEIETATPKHAVTPAPTLPAHELLGDLLTEQKRPAEALVAYRRALELYPRRFNSLLGAARAAYASGDAARARIYYAQLVEIASDSTRQPGLTEARRFVAKLR
jgi:tetratricopeptide (TPR) repeat protein